MTDNWVQHYCSSDRSVEVHNLDGVAWYDAPLPSRLHRCRAQTYGYFDYFTLTERCACGAIRFNNQSWRQRNSRRKK